MNKCNLLLTLVSLLGFSTVVGATIDAECGQNNAHAIYVCPEIKKAIDDWKQFAPPQPFFETQLKTLEFGTYTFEPPPSNVGGGGGWPPSTW